ncbi:SulP family inorganic anion transporter [uncultured Cohaesibacter sp.]|uniref:SulP family inorganic anion transporter n=1 Tax=uncultured Cohaesibacter sp. TaxID=1002546 RepID=UPI0029C95A15|nr:SulP family inorganic anion transporter [uncultured Cohaesibacter sp.]
MYRYLSLRRPWFSLIRRETVFDDFWAGATNAAVVLPQAVAFSLIAGLPPQYGLFTAVVVTLVAAFWGSSLTMVSGPTTAISAVLFATLSEYALPGTERYIALALTLTLVVGAVQLAAGFAKLGGLISFISHSVIVGFTCSAALLILVSQIAPSLGISIEQGGGVLERLDGLFQSLHEANWTAITITLITLASLTILSFLHKRLPSYVLALVIGSLAAMALDAKEKGVRMFEALESVVPTLTAPDMNPLVIIDLIPSAATIAFIALLEAISIGKSFAIRRREPFDSNQEIIGQGLSNIIGSFFQSYAGSGSFTRSGLNADSGARTPLSAIFSSVILLALVLALAPFVRYVPTPAMAAVILFVAYRLIKFSEIRHILETSRSETIILLATFLTGVIYELDLAILVGVLVSLLVFLNQSAHPIVSVGAPKMRDGRRVFRNAHTFNLPQCPQVMLLGLEGPLFFASIEHVEREFRRFEALDDQLRTKILNIKGGGKIDLSGADFLANEIKRARSQHKDFHIVCSHPTTINTLKRLQVTSALGEGNRHSHKTDAITAALAHVDESICATCHLRAYVECESKAGAGVTDEEPRLRTVNAMD